MAASRIPALLQDGEILFEHAVKTGKVPLDSQFLKISEELQRPDRHGDATAVAALYHEIDQLVQAVKPMTLQQLKDGESGYARLWRAFSNLTPFILGPITLLLICYLSFQSSQLNKANTALVEYEQWLGERPREKLYNAWKMYRYENVLNIRQPPLAQLDAYNKLVEEARSLVNKGTAIHFLLQESSTVIYVPQIFESHGPAWLKNVAMLVNGTPSIDQFKDLPSSDSISGAGAYAGTGTPPYAPAPAGAGSAAAGTAPAMQPPPAHNFDCEKADRALSRIVATVPKAAAGASGRGAAAAAQNDYVENLETYNGSFECFLRTMDISSSQLNYSPWITIYGTKQKIALLGAWLLPGLYGLLGACVYLLREYLDPTSKAFTERPTLLALLTVPLRLALGGLAGIIIGWFWAPSAATVELPSAPVSSLSFGVAFLAGFSIETLFSLLDRFRQSINKPGEAAK